MNTKQNQTISTSDGEYAHPEALVSVDWVAEHLNDPMVRIIESNECPAPRFFVETGQVQRRIISWELARGVRGNLTRQEL